MSTRAGSRDADVTGGAFLLEISGWLWKKNQRLGWEKRHFQLNSHWFAYYEKPGHDFPLGFLNASDILLVQPGSKARSRRFDVVTGAHVYQLLAPSLEALHKWLETISKIIERSTRLKVKGAQLRAKSRAKRGTPKWLKDFWASAPSKDAQNSSFFTQFAHNIREWLGSSGGFYKVAVRDPQIMRKLMLHCPDDLRILTFLLELLVSAAPIPADAPSVSRPRSRRDSFTAKQRADGHAIDAPSMRRPVALGTYDSQPHATNSMVVRMHRRSITSDGTLFMNMACDSMVGDATTNGPAHGTAVEGTHLRGQHQQDYKAPDPHTRSPASGRPSPLGSDSRRVGKGGIHHHKNSPTPRGHRRSASADGRMQRGAWDARAHASWSYKPLLLTLRLPKVAAKSAASAFTLEEKTKIYEWLVNDDGDESIQAFIHGLNTSSSALVRGLCLRILFLILSQRRHNGATHGCQALAEQFAKAIGRRHCGTRHCGTRTPVPTMKESIENHASLMTMLLNRIDDWNETSRLESYFVAKGTHVVNSSVFLAFFTNLIGSRVYPRLKCLKDIMYLIINRRVNCKALSSVYHWQAFLLPLLFDMPDTTQAKATPGASRTVLGKVRTYALGIFTVVHWHAVTGQERDDIFEFAGQLRRSLALAMSVCSEHSAAVSHSMLSALVSRFHNDAGNLVSLGNKGSSSSSKSTSGSPQQRAVHRWRCLHHLIRLILNYTLIVQPGVIAGVRESDRALAKRKGARRKKSLRVGSPTHTTPTLLTSRAMSARSTSLDPGGKTPPSSRGGTHSASGGGETPKIQSFYGGKVSPGGTHGHGGGDAKSTSGGGTSCGDCDDVPSDRLMTHILMVYYHVRAEQDRLQVSWSDLTLSRVELKQNLIMDESKRVHMHAHDIRALYRRRAREVHVADAKRIPEGIVPDMGDNGTATSPTTTHPRGKSSAVSLSYYGSFWKSRLVPNIELLTRVQLLLHDLKHKHPTVQSGAHTSARSPALRKAIDKVLSYAPFVSDSIAFLRLLDSELWRLLRVTKIRDLLVSFCAAPDTNRRRKTFHKSQREKNAEDKKLSQALQKRLTADMKKDEHVYRILLLGPGQSGKSTIYKQLTFLHGDGFSAAKRATFKSQIYANIVGTLQSLLLHARRAAERVDESVYTRPQDVLCALLKMIMRRRASTIAHVRQALSVGEENTTSLKSPTDAESTTSGTTPSSKSRSSVDEPHYTTPHTLAHEPIAEAKARATKYDATAAKLRVAISRQQEHDVLEKRYRKQLIDAASDGTGLNEAMSLRKRIQSIKKSIDKDQKHVSKWVAQYYNLFRVPDQLTGDAEEVQSVALDGDDIIMTVRLHRAIARIWKCRAIREIFARRAGFKEHQVDDSSKYWMGHLDRILPAKRLSRTVYLDHYVPSLQDVLNCRKRTRGIVEGTFSVDTRCGRQRFRVVDVAGQRGVRRKWIPFFDSCNCVLFVVSLAGYNRFLAEQPDILRLHEGISLFRDVVNQPALARTPFIVFLNKIDLFQAELATTPLSKCFPEYNPPAGAAPGSRQDIASAVAYVRGKLQGAADNPARAGGFYFHTTSATDTNQVDKIFKSVTDIVINKGLEEAGLA